MENKKKKILVVEDSPEIAQVILSSLQEVGYEVEAAIDGSEGIQKIKNDKYDLILLDLVLPKKTGFDVMSEAKLMNLETPILVFSNLSEEFTREEALKMGAKDYFEKSKTSLDDVIKKIKKWTGK